METTRSVPKRSTARLWDMEKILLVAAAGLTLVVAVVGIGRYNPAPLDVEAGWFFSP
jgi:hypothetical protein